uniref:Vesicle transport protein n=1 Tax=Rhodosorus marinus TaxID=101924 RepID=A0A7S3EM37_9RHOD|mmetsp:Transcript_44381/g.172513  ORF Transcript_44381/g.172513 Transcript_44381/m.172513 type:complete len:238 (+) Transcript_44381:76-789(+)
MGLLDNINNLQGLQGFQREGVADSLSDFQNAAMKSLGNVGEKLGDLGESAAGTLKGSVYSVRNFIGDDGGPSDIESNRKPEEFQQQTTSEELNEILNLTWTQRLILFLMTFAAGAIMMCLAVMFIPLIVVKPAKFALSFTFGNVLAVISTWFLVGPRAQLRSMFDPIRAWAAALYVGSLVVTLISIFINSRIRYFLVLAAIVVEAISLVWYAMSYIPYGRTVISKLLNLIWGGSISL